MRILLFNNRIKITKRKKYLAVIIRVDNKETAGCWNIAMYIDRTERITNNNQPAAKKAKSNGSSFADVIETLLHVDAVNISLPREKREKKQPYKKQTEEQPETDENQVTYASTTESKENVNITV